MDYIDGFVCSVKNENKQKYIAYAQKAAKLFKEHGAKTVVETWGDSVPEGVLTSFPLAVKCEKDETVVFSWITWPSKEVHDASWDKLMAHPFFQTGMSEAPYDGKRMIFGGFEQIV
jgi:uncharacterized protein YbaA (DUF1428 family)